MALVVVVLAACSSGDKAAPPAPTFSLETTTTAPAPSTAVSASILSPEKASVQGSAGRGMVVALTFTAKDPANLAAEFRLGLPSSAATAKPGHNPAFPGLVVVLDTTGVPLGGPGANLANLFQIVSPSPQPDGSVRVTAIWTNADVNFGSDVDVTLVALVVSGTAPDTMPALAADLKTVSNSAQVTFHLAGGAVAGSTTTVASKATTTTKPGGTTTSSTSTTKPAGGTTTTAKAPATTTTTVPATTTTTKFLGLL